jgi:hypothetical protein
MNLASITTPAAPAAPAAPTAATTAPGTWADRFLGQPLAYFADEFPNWNGIYATSTAYIGDHEGYASLKDARAAVSQLHPMPPASDPKDPKTYPNAVAFVESDHGQVVAFELDQPLVWLQPKLFRHAKLTSAPAFKATNERVVAVDNVNGSVPRDHMVWG